MTWTHQMDLNWVPNVTFTSMCSVHDALCTSLEGTQTGKNAPKLGLKVVIATSHSMMNCGAQSLHDSCDKNLTSHLKEYMYIWLWAHPKSWVKKLLLQLCLPECHIWSPCNNWNWQQYVARMHPFISEGIPTASAVGPPSSGAKNAALWHFLLKSWRFSHDQLLWSNTTTPSHWTIHPFMSKGNMLCYDDNTIGILVLCSSGPASGSPIMMTAHVMGLHWKLMKQSSYKSFQVQRECLLLQNYHPFNLNNSLGKMELMLPNTTQISGLWA